ncbi:hypothetical protein O0K45_11840, partial [Staphylococcus pseudintermedius]|nr:hypothetical protein [Staphylococcus pseudintermedius]
MRLVISEPSLLSIVFIYLSVLIKGARIKFYHVVVKSQQTLFRNQKLKCFFFFLFFKFIVFIVCFIDVF